MSDEPEWVEQARRLVAGLGQTLGSTLQEGARGADGSGHPADCRWCPVCQVAAVLRGERPEVTAALADVLSAAASALRSFAEAAQAGREEEAPAPPAEKSSPVQRVEIA